MYLYEYSRDSTISMRFMPGRVLQEAISRYTSAYAYRRASFWMRNLFEKVLTEVHIKYTQKNSYRSVSKLQCNINNLWYKLDSMEYFYESLKWDSLILKLHFKCIWNIREETIVLVYRFIESPFISSQLRRKRFKWLIKLLKTFLIKKAMY